MQTPAKETNTVVATSPVGVPKPAGQATKVEEPAQKTAGSVQPAKGDVKESEETPIGMTTAVASGEAMRVVEEVQTMGTIEWGPFKSLKNPECISLLASVVSEHPLMQATDISPIQVAQGLIMMKTSSIIRATTSKETAAAILKKIRLEKVRYASTLCPTDTLLLYDVDTGMAVKSGTASKDVMIKAISKYATRFHNTSHRQIKSAVAKMETEELKRIMTIPGELARINDKWTMILPWFINVKAKSGEAKVKPGQAPPLPQQPKGASRAKMRKYQR